MGTNLDPLRGFEQRVHIPRFARIFIGVILILGAVPLGFVAILLTFGKGISGATAFLGLISVLCGVMGVRLLRMTSAGHLFSATGSMIGGVLSVSIGVAVAVWSYFEDVKDGALIASLPIFIGMILYWFGKQRLTLRASGFPASERE